MCPGAPSVYAVLGWNELPPPALAETCSAVGSLLQGIVSSGVALAGSLVAIFLAVLGLRIVREQEAREQEIYLRTYLADALAPVKRVALELDTVVFRYLARAELAGRRHHWATRHGCSDGEGPIVSPRAPRQRQGAQGGGAWGSTCRGRPFHLNPGPKPRRACARTRGRSACAPSNAQG